MSESTTVVAAGNVLVVGGPTPMVLSVSRRLREGLARGLTFTAADTPRVVCLASATDAQRAFVTFADAEIVVSADSGGTEPDITWDVLWPDPVPADTQNQTPDGFAKEVQLLLSARDGDWRSAAEQFWRRVQGVSGVPEGLSVYCVEEDAIAGFGDAAGDGGYRLSGTSAALTRLFGGRSLLTEELARGELALDGSVSAFSALFGANLKVVLGEV